MPGPATGGALAFPRDRGRRERVNGVETVVLLVAVLVAATTQVTVGFGFALLSVPLMTMAVPTKESVVISTFLGLVTSSFQAWHGRREVDRSVARRLIGWAVVGLPFGWLLFTRLSDDVLRAVLGVSVLVAVALLASGTVARGSSAIDATCGVVSGALASSLSTNGPPLVFALQARGMPMSVFRPTINTVFTVSGALSLAGFLVNGDVGSDAAVHSLLAVPVLVIGSRVGFRRRDHVPETGARRVVLALLALAGISAILVALV